MAQPPAHAEVVRAFFETWMAPGTSGADAAYDLVAEGFTGLGPGPGDRYMTREAVRDMFIEENEAADWEAHEPNYRMECLAVASILSVHEALGVLGRPWRHPSPGRPTSYAVAYGTVGVATLILSRALAGFSAWTAWGAGVFELTVAALWLRRLRQPSAGDVT